MIFFGISELQLNFHDVVFPPSELDFKPRFLKIVVEGKVSAVPHILKLWSWANKGTLNVKYCCQKILFLVSVEFDGYHKTVRKLK